MRNALACVAKRNRPMVAAALRNAFDQPSREAASLQWRKLVDAFAEPADRLAKLMREAEDDVLAFMAFPKEHRTELHSTNPLERLNKEVKRRTHVVGIFPNDDAIMRSSALCHAVGRSGDSPNVRAPRFRELHSRYLIETLAEPLSKGAVAPHSEMPRFQLSEKEVAAVIAYLNSLASPR